MYAPPTVQLSGAPSSSVNGAASFDLTARFNRNVTGLTASDINVTNGTATAISGGPSVYTITVQPDGNGPVSVTVPRGAAQGTTSRRLGNAVSNTATVAVDTQAPSVALSASPVSSASSTMPGGGTTPFNVTATFSESVTGFDATDLVVANATVTVTGGPTVYSILVTPDGTGPVSISVPAASAQDSASNANTASNTLSFAGTQPEIEATEELIASAAVARSQAILAQQPDLVFYLADRQAGRFDVQAARGILGVDFATGSGGPVWLQFTLAKTDVDESENLTAFGAIGTHRQINENLLVGAMLQFDINDFEDGTETHDSTGWLAGPYFLARSQNKRFYVEGVLLYGQTDNEISPLGTYTDQYDGDRVLATLKVANETVANTYKARQYIRLAMPLTRATAMSIPQAMSLKVQPSNLVRLPSAQTPLFH